MRPLRAADRSAYRIAVMDRITIYHNPRCSKSRQTMAVLEQKGIEPQVIEYLKHPPDRPTIQRLLKMLGMRPIELMRTKESAFAELGLDPQQSDDDTLIDAMVAHPILIERPIVVRGDKAKIGRPPEGVLEIL